MIWLWSFSQGLQELTNYLRKEYSHENIRFWLATNQLRSGPASRILHRVQEIYQFVFDFHTFFLVVVVCKTLCVSIELGNFWHPGLRVRSISMDGQWTLSSTRWNARHGLLSIERPSTFTTCCLKKIVTHVLYVLIITNSCWPMHSNHRRRKGNPGLH